jgi:transcriptional regulator with XRE-family HTH domain
MVFMGGQDIRDILGKNIKTIRFHQGLSQAELAEKADISVNFLSNLERGMKWPRSDTLSQIARAFSVPIAELFKEETAIPDSFKEILAHYSEDVSRLVNQSIKSAYDQYSRYMC